MKTFVHRSGQMVDKHTGEPMLTPEMKSRKPAIPIIMGFKAYSCPITGKPISTLEQHNENLKVHNCVEALEVNRKGATGGKIRNSKFAKKHGLKVSEEYRDTPDQPKERIPYGK